MGLTRLNPDVLLRKVKNNWVPRLPQDEPPYSRKRTTTYKLGPTYLAAHIKNLPKTEEVCDGDVVVCSQTNYQYDVYAADGHNAPLTEYTTPTGYVAPPAGNGRGNRTRMQRATNTNLISTYTNYDVLETLATIDGRGFKTSFEYDSDGNAYAYRSKVTNPLNHSQVFVDTQAPFDEVLKTRYSGSINWDRVHPDYVGSMVLARAFVDAIGFDWTG